MRSETHKVVILGTGTAGFASAEAILEKAKPDDNIEVIVIGKGGGNSIMSPWNFAYQQPPILERALLDNLGFVDI